MCCMGFHSHFHLFFFFFWKRSRYRLLESFGANTFHVMCSEGFHTVSNHLRSFFIYLQKEIIHINKKEVIILSDTIVPLDGKCSHLWY